MKGQIKTKKTPAISDRSFCFSYYAAFATLLLDNEIGNRKPCVEFTSFSEQFLAVSSEDSLTWAEALWIENNWSLCKWNVWAVEVTTVHVAVTFVSHEDLTCWEERIFV